MIFLRILFWFLIAVLGLILVILLLPVSVFVSYDHAFICKIKLFNISVFSTEKKQKKNKETPQKKAAQKKPSKSGKAKKENAFKHIYHELGFSDSVRAFSRLLRTILQKNAWILKRIRFRDLRLIWDVCSADAAQTAILYGVVCSTVYPVIELLFSIIDCKAKNIDISADFNHSKNKINFSLAVCLQPWMLLIGFISGYFSYKKWRRDLHE